MDTMTCRWCGEPIRRTGNVWVHDGLAATVYCLAGLIRGWLVPEEPPESWGVEAIGRELAAAGRAADRTLESLAAVGEEVEASRAAMDRAGAGGTAAAYQKLGRMVDTYRGEVAEIADQLKLLATTAAGTGEQPTPRALITALTSLLEDIGVATLAILHTGLMSAQEPSLDPGLRADPPRHLIDRLGQAHDQLAESRAHLDRAREAVAATLTTAGQSGGTR